MHRAEQVVDAMVELQPTDAKFKNRTLSLSEIDFELPASIVRIGEDEPADADGAANLAFLDSLLSLDCDLYARADTEEGAISALMELRRLQHVAIQVDRTLGLSFVIDTRYAGASEPEIEANTEYVAARLTARWQVHYRMNITDPE